MIKEKVIWSQEFVGKAHAFCLDFHAYQTISAGATTSGMSISNPKAKIERSSARPSIAEKMLKMVKTMPTMMFAQRFILSFKVRDRTAITNGTNRKIAFSSKNAPVIGSPSNFSALISSIVPGAKNANTKRINQATVKKNQSTAIFIFQSSRIFHLPI